MNNPTPKPAEVVAAAKNVDKSLFRETHPHTQAVEDMLAERLELLHEQRERVLKEAEDLKEAIAGIGDHMDRIREAKK